MSTTIVSSLRQRMIEDMSKIVRRCRKRCWICSPA